MHPVKAVAHGYQALAIGIVDINTTAVAGQVGYDTGETRSTFVFVPVDLSTTSTTSLVVVIIRHSTDFSSTVHVRFVKIIAIYDYW